MPRAHVGLAEHDGFRRCVAREPIGHEGARHHSQSLQEFAQEAFRGVRVSAALNQDFKNLASVIDGPPQPTAPVVSQNSAQVTARGELRRTVVEAQNSAESLPTTNETAGRLLR